MKIKKRRKGIEKEQKKEDNNMKRIRERKTK